MFPHVAAVCLKFLVFSLEFGLTGSYKHGGRERYQAAGDGGETTGQEESPTAEVRPSGRGTKTAEKREESGGAGSGGQLGEAAGGAGVRSGGRAGGETRGGDVHTRLRS